MKSKRPREKETVTCTCSKCGKVYEENAYVALSAAIIRQNNICKECRNA